MKTNNTIIGSLALITILAFGCADDTSPTDDNTDDLDFAPPAEPGFQISSGAVEVGAGEEKTICVFLNAPNTQEMSTVMLEQANRGYVHHFILFRSTDPVEPGTGECPESELFIRHPPIYPGTRNQGPFVMPDGVALPMAQHQGLILQLHFLNSTDTPVQEEIRMNFHAGAADTAYLRAGVVGASDFNFEIPASTPKHTETQRCYITREISLFAMTSHSHERTMSFDVKVNAKDGTRDIYTSKNWSEPEVGHYDPVIEVGNFGWFEFSCTWYNDSPHPVTYGGTAQDEMCMMFGYYYPAESDLLPCIGL